MTQNVINYAKDLENANVSKEIIAQTREILETVPQIREDFENPTVEIAKKQ